MNPIHEPINWTNSLVWPQEGNKKFKLNNLKVLAGGLFKKKVKKILLQHQFFTVDDFMNFHF